jgi:hypothetical protein
LTVVVGGVVVAVPQRQGFLSQTQPATKQRSKPQSLQRVQQSVRSTAQLVQPFVVRLPIRQYGHNFSVAAAIVVIFGGVVVVDVLHLLHIPSTKINASVGVLQLVHTSIAGVIGVVAIVVAVTDEIGADGETTPSTSDLSTSINKIHVDIHGGAN